jgi:23S rRNA (uracil1939-C5)-methyltransferase
LKFKQQTVLDALERIGKFPAIAIDPIRGCEIPFYYRNKMEFTFSSSRWLTEEEMNAHHQDESTVHVGLHVPQRFDKVVDIEECWLQSELSNAILNRVRIFSRERGLPVYSTETHEGYLRHLTIREGKRTGEVMINLVTNDDRPEIIRDLVRDLVESYPAITTIVNNITSRKSMVAVGEREIVCHGPGFITEKIGACTFRISANSFFQTNSQQAELLYETVRTLGAFRKDDVVYDLYCGTGTIAIYLASAVSRVVGIELVESAIADAELNAGLNGVTNAHFVQGDLKDRLTRDTEWLAGHPPPTVIVTDPPRSGMHEKVVKAMIALAPERIVYVSCNPATQARDLRLLADSGYELVRVSPVDMFPHTSHIEAVALLHRIG